MCHPTPEQLRWALLQDIAILASETIATCMIESVSDEYFLLLRLLKMAQEQGIIAFTPRFNEILEFEEDAAPKSIDYNKIFQNITDKRNQ